MLTILGVCGSALDGDDHLALMRMRDTHLLRETLHGVCEDDCESAAPYIGMCPDESSHPEGSPLDFGGITAVESAQFDADMAAAMRLGFAMSCAASQCDNAAANGYNAYTGEPHPEWLKPVHTYYEPS